MNPEVANLAQAWEKWGLLGALRGVTWSSEDDENIARFESNDETFVLSKGDDGWWTVDRTNDRGKRFNAIAKFSDLNLAAKYLNWNWASTARSAQGLSVQDPALYALGVAEGVSTFNTDREGYLEIRGPRGSAVLPEPYASIFSHVMNFTEEEVDEALGPGLP